MPSSYPNWDGFNGDTQGPIPEGFEVKQARIVRKASGYFVMLSLQLNVDVPSPMPHGHPRGLDLGFDKFAATR